MPQDLYLMLLINLATSLAIVKHSDAFANNTSTTASSSPPIPDNDFISGLPFSLLVPFVKPIKSSNTAPTTVHELNEFAISSSTCHPTLSDTPSTSTTTSNNYSPSHHHNHHYIIGYGSLMETESKQRTAPFTGESIPVLVKGFRREWNAQGSSIGASTTYLGVIEDPTASFNAIVFKLLPNNNNTNNTKNMADILKSYDEREIWYCRYKVPPKFVIPLSNNDGHNNNNSQLLLTNNATFWIYVNKPEFTSFPNKRYPIVQSYVDIFLAGCLEIEYKFHLPNFTDFCIESTFGWSKEWINDRIYPRRPFIFQPKATEIDAALARNIPTYFNQIILHG